MKALYFDGQLELRDVEKPRPAPGEALIQVLLAGICGTDQEILKGYADFRGIPGHEFVGRVVECEEKKWLGKRVVGEINIACGECDLCLWGLGRHCPKRTVMGIVNRPGVFAEFVTLPVVNLHEVPKALSNEAAVFVEPLAAAAEILEQMQVPPAAHVAVIGDGRLGLLVAQVLHNAKAHVTVIGKHAWKLDLARGWGMKVASFDDEGIPARRFSVVVEASGSPAGLDQAFRLVAPRGTVVMKSTFHGQAQVDTTQLVVDEITLLGSRCGDFRRALELLARGRVKVQPLVSKTFPLEAGLEAFQYLNTASCLKVLLAPTPAKSR
jgi:2-desacetyl-2-hydroxyethyl bacteriochlorophyllide A dehydrogenase